MNLRSFLITFLAFWVGPTLTSAENPAAASAEKTRNDAPVNERLEREQGIYRFTVSPAPAPSPVTKYTLLVPPDETRSGDNAVVYYQRIDGLLQYKPIRSAFTNIDECSEWLDLSQRDFPIKECRKLMNNYKSEMGPYADWLDAMIDLAASTPRCDWQFEQEAESTGITPISAGARIQVARVLARYCSTKAQLALAEGRWADALHDCQIVMTVGQHVATNRYCIPNLVGLAASGIVLDQIGDLVQQADAPNLYWALASLPHPLFDLLPVLKKESNLHTYYPELDQFPDRPMSGQECKTLVDRLGKRFQMYESLKSIFGIVPEKTSDFSLMNYILECYPEAKRLLLASGFSEEKIEAMPAAQVVFLALKKDHEQYCNRVMAIYYASPETIFLQYDQLDRDKRFLRITPPFAIELFGLTAAVRAHIRMERNFTMLRVLEAIRLYAAGHDGRLPDALDDIKEVPIPDDPMNGKPFVYRRNGKTAELESPIPPGTSNPNYYRRFIITMR